MITNLKAYCKIWNDVSSHSILVCKGPISNVIVQKLNAPFLHYDPDITDWPRFQCMPFWYTAFCYVAYNCICYICYVDGTYESTDGVLTNM